MDAAGLQGPQALPRRRHHRADRGRGGAAGGAPRRGERLSRLFDSHAHLDFEALRSPEVARRALAAGVTDVLVPGVEPGQWARARELDGRGLSLRFAAGIHPQREGTIEALEAFLDERGAAAIGELGWHAGVPHRDALVDAQLELARARGLPVILHVVGAQGHALGRLRRHGPLRGVVHAYSGSAELVRDYVGLGLHVSIGPSVLRPRARRVHAACAAIPEERLLVETDAPDQSPEPADLVDVIAKVAELRGRTVEEVGRRCADNARALFG